MKAALTFAYRQYWFYVSPTKLVIRRAIRTFFEGRPPCDRLLELGGGTSMMRTTLQRACRPAYLVSSDIDPTESTDLVCDAQMLPFSTATFDVLVAFELMEHIPDTSRLLQEMSRVVKPGGYVMVSVPFLFGVHDHQDFYRFTEQGLERVLAIHGLPAVAILKSGGISFTIVVLLIEYLRTLGLPPSEGWRSRGWRRQAHLTLSSVVTAPLTLLSWLAFGVDSVVDRNSRNPSGLVVVARRAGDGSVGAPDIGGAGTDGGFKCVTSPTGSDH